MKAIVVAYAKNRVIGKNNDLPWYLPADLKRFKQLTTGHTVIMGRKTHESIIKRLGSVLPNRRSIVLSRHPIKNAFGAGYAASLEQALAQVSDDNVYIIGGASVFEEALPITDRIYATEVRAVIDGDVYMPEIDLNNWKEVERKRHEADEKNQYGYDFVTYERAV